MHNILVHVESLKISMSTSVKNSLLMNEYIDTRTYKEVQNIWYICLLVIEILRKNISFFIYQTLNIHKKFIAFISFVRRHAASVCIRCANFWQSSLFWSHHYKKVLVSSLHIGSLHTCYKTLYKSCFTCLN